MLQRWLYVFIIWMAESLGSSVTSPSVFRSPFFREKITCKRPKRLTLSYFLNLLSEICAGKNIPIRHEHLDLCNPRPCFRALNDLACLLNASKRYQKGISLEEMMIRIETTLADYHGYLILFTDEVDNVRRDKDNFMTFLVRRLSQKIPAKLILVFVSNRLDWPDHLDPRVKSFLKLNELIFKPYDAIGLQHILRIRVEKALCPKAVEPGVIEKIAAMGAIVEATRRSEHGPIGTGEAYDAYKAFSKRAELRPLTGRAFGDLISELDIYSLLRSRVLSRGRYGRTREIILDLPQELTDRLYDQILLNLEIHGQSNQKKCTGEGLFETERIV